MDKEDELIIDDPVYGKVKIDEPVLIDLIESNPVQRLKGICQNGPRDYWHRNTFSRYSHSIGVLILLRILGATLKEHSEFFDKVKTTSENFDLSPYRLRSSLSR